MQVFNSETSICDTGGGIHPDVGRTNHPQAPTPAPSPVVVESSPDDGHNYILSTTSLFEGKCGSGAAPRPDPIKRHLVSARNIYDGTMDPLAVVYGPVRAYLDCRTTV